MSNENDLVIKLKRPHASQQIILDEAKRFNVLKCGRRFGKTDLSIELAVQPMLDGFPVGYWYPNYKDGEDYWRELKRVLRPIIDTKNEQTRYMSLITGGHIDMWSLEDPDSGRGRKYKRSIIDEAEKARHLKEAWENTIRATLTDYKGDAWFLSTPKFGITYFKETLFKNQNRFDDWKSWRFTTYDNPFMDKQEIDSAKAQLDELTFRCEYLAEDVDVIGKPFAWAFSREKHLATDLSLPVWKGDKNHHLYLSFDFNLDPMSCLVVQHINGIIYCIESISIPSSNIYEMCERIKTKYPGYLYLVTGDASGKGSTALVKDNLNYYTVIVRELRIMNTQLRIPSRNPDIEENSALVNGILTHYPVLINPTQCESLIFDLMYVQIGDNNKIKKDDRTNREQRADALDCFRYYLNTFHSNFLTLRRA